MRENRTETPRSFGSLRARDDVNRVNGNDCGAMWNFKLQLNSHQRPRESNQVTKFTQIKINGIKMPSSIQLEDYFPYFHHSHSRLVSRVNNANFLFALPQIPLYERILILFSLFAENMHREEEKFRILPRLS